MPIIRTQGKLIYFAHVPKCGGTAVEQYLHKRFGSLAFMDESFYSLPESFQWTRSSAQHISVDNLNRLFPAHFFDAAFAVVRHPVDRIVSEFHYLRDNVKRIDMTEDFSAWLRQLEDVIARKPFMYDGHLRPMLDVVPEGATIFKLEDGLEQVGRYLDGITGVFGGELHFEHVRVRDGSIEKICPNPDEIAAIERIYRRDFEKFGYSLQYLPDSGKVSGCSIVKSPASEVRTVTNQSAGQYRNDGVAAFLKGEMVDAHSYFRFALNGDPCDTQSHALIANTALRLGALHLSARHAVKALESEPGNLDALMALAGARLRLRHPKMRESVEALAPFAELGELRRLMRLAVEAAENVDDHEGTLFELAQYLETNVQDVFARELMTDAFNKFRNSADQERFAQFIDGLSVLADRSDAPPLDKPELWQVHCVDVIIPVYNGIGDLSACLASIRKYWSAAVRQIILVDDCSTSETAAWLSTYRDAHTDVLLIRNVENLGFTRAVMVGVEQSSAPYMLFLNSDTLVTNQWLEGMLECMTAASHTALVGPLSNNGFHQTIQPTQASGGAQVSERAPHDVATEVLENTRKGFPRVPFLSGFCLLVHRGAFDQAGGLDCEAFPHGYWEVQDLCLKLTDLGFNSVIADHVYVHHVGGGSIASQRRTDLTAAGMARMFDRYSGLRVTMAEAVSASEPEVARHRIAWAERDLKAGLVSSPKSSPIDQPPSGGFTGLRCLKVPPRSVAGREVCLFALHCPLGSIPEYTQTYLEELKRCGLLIIACLVVDDLDTPISEEVIAIADGVVLRGHAGHEFGFWAAVLRKFPYFWGAERLYFANDSVFGPFRPLSPIIERIRSENSGFFALTDNALPVYHADAAFFGWNQRNLASFPLREFWDNLDDCVGSKIRALDYELSVARLSVELPDHTQQILFGLEAVKECDQTVICSANPRTAGWNGRHGWRRLLAAGLPFVKVEDLQEGLTNVDYADWEAVCGTWGADVEALHCSIEALRIDMLKGRHLLKGVPHD